MTATEANNALYPQEIENDELNALLTTIRNQGDEIEMKDKEITRLKARLEKLEPKEKPAAKKPAAKKAPAKKPAAPKTNPAAAPKAEKPAEPKK